MTKGRVAHLLLHRKIACEHICICGSNMECINGVHMCERQYRLGEPKAIEVYIDDKPMVVRG